MDNSVFFSQLAVMALVTYAIRVVPYLCIKKEIKNSFLKSFLAYIPYTVLAAMTIPSILFATDNFLGNLLALIVGIAVAYFEKGLLVVALSTCATVLIVDILSKLI